MAEVRKAPRWFSPRFIQRAFEERQVEPLINGITWQLHFWHPLNFGRERERRLKGAYAVTTRHHCSEPEREVNPLPLIDVTVQLAECGKCIRQVFEVRSLFGLTFLHVLVRLVHGKPL